MLWLILQCVLGACALGAIYFAGMAQLKKWDLEKQGVVFLPYFPLCTDFIRIIVQSINEPNKFPILEMARKALGTDDLPDKLGIMMFGMPIVIFTNPKALDEIYVTKNQFHTKHQLERTGGYPLIGASIVSLDSDDPKYKPKRKSLSAAFFKNKVEKMTVAVKENILRIFKKLQAKGDVNEVNMNKFTAEVQASIIVSILVGREYVETMVPYQDMYTGAMTEMSIPNYMNQIMDDILVRFKYNWLILMFPSLIPKQIFKVDKYFFHNCFQLRGAVREIIEKRKRGEVTGGLKAGDDELDLIGMLIEDEAYAKSEDIIDDVIVMFIAGSQTVQMVTTNFITTMLVEPEAFKKFKAEQEPLMEMCKDDIMGKMTLESVEELDYTKLAYTEVLRRDPSIPSSSTSTVTKPCTIGGISFKKGDPFYIGISQMHQHKDTWKQPKQFIPERFDSTSEFYSRPDGGKRNPLAFNAFLGGQRVCLGKTFAEITLKFTLPLWYHFFDFSFVKEEHYTKRPVVELGAPSIAEIPVKMTTKNRVE